MSFFDFVRSILPWKSAKAKAPSFGRVPLEQVAAKEKERESPVEPLDSAVEAAHFADGPIDAFVHFGQWLPVKSSNVEEIRYDADQSELFVKFKNGNVYQYEGVSIREAESMARAASHGKWVWDHLRYRGVGNFWSYRKPYTLIPALSTGVLPQWMRAEEPSGRKDRARKIKHIHGMIGPEGLRYKGRMAKKIRKIIAPKWARGKSST